ncbi:hypothetical protein KSF_002640 [Reticulibacter mediterranei]|uniref:Tail specific protease domain-containing protein n=2 Tax=Reticulibacter mediterranei TaxID=2778369 RepID=A0A8J3IIE7_9CHLR|nr:hypothetical protein KSF_002640 [Reticulibacter mediterranei]
MMSTCVRQNPAQGRVGTAADAAANPVGIYRSDGYGFFVQIDHDKLLLSQTTAISCFPVAVAVRAADTPTGTRQFIVDEKRSKPKSLLDVTSGLLTVSAGKTKDEKRLHVDGAISDIVLERVPAQPKTCVQPMVNTPVNNFDIFWNTFRENYPFFKQHGLNWDAVREKFRPQVTPATTPAQLEATFVEMIKPLQDAHTAVNLPSQHLTFTGERPDPQPVTDAEFRQANRIVDSRLVGKRQSFANDHISFGLLPKDIGYLDISSFDDYTDSGRSSDALDALNHALDVAFAKPLNGLVIDVRNNGGGSDAYGVAVASRLTRQGYVAYAKTARDDPNNPSTFTAPQSVTVQPSARSSFHGPIALLTSRYSVSAAETFTQALLGRPNITRIGENTQGVFSDIMLRVLPDGITFGLPNEVYTTDGRSYDVVGFTPDICTGLVFKRTNLRAGYDPELDAAMNVLTQKVGHRDGVLL